MVMKVNRVNFGYSFCPNDTFAFYAISCGLVQIPFFTIRSVLADIEKLNNWARFGKLELTKISFYALGFLLDNYLLLRTGAVLGRGCGPIVVVRSDCRNLNLSKTRIVVPGRLTTAVLLLSLFLGKIPLIEVMSYDKIMQVVSDGYFQAGLVIHEGRFTFKKFGLKQILDLGQWWEGFTGLPVPLGCIALRRDVVKNVGKEIVLSLERALAKSIIQAQSYFQASQNYVLTYAQEMELAVVKNYIRLYVNEFSLKLGQNGLLAVIEIFERSHLAGLIPYFNVPLTI